jgi:putative copper export protein
LIWSGHAHASDKHAWLLPSDLLHVVAAGAWPGGLLPLALLLAQARRDPGLVLPVLRVTRRFSRLSVAAVSVLALSGLLNSVGLVGTLAALWPGVYGRLILCKAALLAVMVGLGAVNRRIIHQDDSGDVARTLRSLCRNVAWEGVLAVVVVLATEALAMSAPPAAG